MKLIAKNTFAGERIIYYDSSGRTAFSPDELAPVDRNIDPLAIYDYLLFDTILPPHSIWQGVSSLFPGEALWRGDDGKLILNNEEYKSLTGLPTLNESPIVLAARLDELFAEYFEKTVAKDKPVALMLSGGIDSAIIASYLPKHAVCATWAGWGGGSTDLTFARLNFSRFGLKSHLPVYIDYDADEKIYDAALSRLRHPFSIIGGVPYLRMAEKLQEHFQGQPYQLFMGENADTIAGAYETGVYAYYLSKINPLLSWLPMPRQLLERYRKLFLVSTSNQVELFAYFSSFGLYPGSWINPPRGYFETKFQEIKNQLGRVRDFRDHILMLELSVGSRRNQFRQSYLPALYGAEMGLPYYDKNIVKFFLQIPQRLRRQDNFGKVVLRELARRRGVPEEVIEKGKKGLSYGHTDFFKQNRHVPIWDEMQKNPVLNRFVNIASLRERQERNFPLLDLLRSLHKYLKLIAR